MNKERKIQLLSLTEELRKKLERYETQSFLSFLSTSSKTYFLKAKASEEYFRLLFFTGQQTRQALNGGKAMEESYKRFIKEELQITRSGELIRVGNPRFSQLQMEELAYLFGWLRRLFTEKEQNKGQNNEWNKERNKGRMSQSNTKSWSYKEEPQEMNAFGKFFSGQ